MTTAVERVYQTALSLTEAERDELIDALVAAQASVDAAWDEEIACRSDEIDAGTAELIPWDQVRAESLRRVGLDG